MDRSPTSLLMYGRRKSEGDLHVSQCGETTLILCAEMALVPRRWEQLRPASVSALSFGPPDDVLNQSPLALGLCKSATCSHKHRLPRLAQLRGVPFPHRKLMRLHLFETSSRVSRWCIRFALCVCKYNEMPTFALEGYLVIVASALRFAFAIG